MNNKHIAWDYSIIDSFFGRDPKQKTTKTICNKRVSLNKIDSNNPNCEDCISIHREDVKSAMAALNHIENS